MIMKKILYIILFTLLSLSACEENGNTPEPPREWTIEELGETIISASVFWDDWWHLRGRFDLNEPTQNFKTLDEIAEYLRQFYTETWLERELFGYASTTDEIGGMFFGSPWAFTEHDGVLHINYNRYGAIRPDWPTASHTLIEQDENRALVETVVTAYDHRGSGYKMPFAIFNFTFIDGKIESAPGTWIWPGPCLPSLSRVIEQEGHFWDSWRNFLWSFDASNIDWEAPRVYHNGHEYARLLPSSGFVNMQYIRNQLSWNYTENWIEQLLASETPPFIEYNEELYISIERPRIPHPVWEIATHVMLEQDDMHAVVETTIGLMYMGEISKLAILRFTFDGWQIAASEGFPCFTDTEMEVHIR